MAESKVPPADGGSTNASAAGSAGGGSTAVSREDGRRALFRFYGVAAVALTCVGAFFCTAPAPTGLACDGITPLWMLRNAKTEGTLERVFKCATEYRQDHEGFLLAGFMLTYATLQTFAIPSSVILSVLCGALYDFHIALPIVICSSTTGATGCFLLSRIFGGGVLSALNLDRHLASFRANVDEKRAEGRLFVYMAMSRVAPMPNTVINLSSPLLGVPLHIFTPATFLGIIPVTSVHIASGRALVSVGKVEKGPVTWVLICGTAILAAIVLWDKRAKKRRQAVEQEKAR